MPLQPIVGEGGARSVLADRGRQPGAEHVVVNAGAASLPGNGAQLVPCTAIRVGGSDQPPPHGGLIQADTVGVPQPCQRPGGSVTDARLGVWAGNPINAESR